MGIDAEMFVRTRTKVTDEEIEEIRYRMCCAFGAGRFSDDYESEDEEGRTVKVSALYRINEYWQDGHTLQPKKGETFIRCGLWTRYYGPGYERGDCPFICAVAEFLEMSFPGGEVWYGGDSSGVLAKRIDRKFLLQHFYTNGHAPYIDYLARKGGVTCPRCKKPMNQHGFGGAGNDWASWTCHGCGRQAVRENGKITVSDRRRHREPDDPQTFRFDVAEGEESQQFFSLLTKALKRGQGSTVEMVLCEWLGEKKGLRMEGRRVIKSVKVKMEEPADGKG